MSDSSNDLAEKRTDWAEDRTVMANERTFAGWMRTGLAAIGLGLAFNALFGKWEPDWVPRLIASVFILTGILIFIAARQRGCTVLDRLNSHAAEPVKSTNLTLIASAMAGGGVMLLIGIWVFGAL